MHYVFQECWICNVLSIPKYAIGTYAWLNNNMLINYKENNQLKFNNIDTSVCKITSLGGLFCVDNPASRKLNFVTKWHQIYKDVQM